jgi:ATP-dependent Clp protease adaptor protein ClpS
MLGLGFCCQGPFEGICLSMSKAASNLPPLDPSRALVPVKAGDNQRGDDPRTGVVIKTRPKVKKPSMYKVLMLNDDYTPMEFVVHVLQRFFNKTTEEATRIMLHVHQKGVGVCGVYTFEVAETKVTQTMDLARKNQHPLQCTLEKE